jgi:hypothetical protein
MIEIGVDNLITDLPAEMRLLIREWESLGEAEKSVLHLRRLLLPKSPLPAAEL